MSSFEQTGRQIKQGAKYLVDQKRPGRAIFLDSHKDDVFFRWKRGVRENRLAKTFGVSREHIEDVIREKVQGDPGPTGRPAIVLPIRRAA